MNILLASRELPGVNDGGGIGVYTLTWAKALQQEGHYVHIVTEDPKRPVNRKNYAFPVDLIAEDPRFGHFAQGYSYALYQHLLRLSRERAWDIMEFPDYLAEGYFTIKAKRLKGEFSDVVLRVHGHMSLELCDKLNHEIPEMDRQRVYHMEQYALRFCDVLSTPSLDLQTHYRQLSGRAVLLTRHPLPVLEEEPGDPGVEMASLKEQEEPMVLYVGRLEYRKGVDLLLKAAVVLWEQGRDFGIWLVGQDTHYQGQSFQEQLRLMIPQAYRSRVHFLGHVNREMISQFYSQAKAVVFPSRFENWPNVCLEALTLGCPIIASKSGGMREMLTSGAGILINPEHTPSFAMALDSVLEDSALAASLKEGARNAVTHLELNPTDILSGVMGHAQENLQPDQIRDVTHFPVISVVITSPQGESEEWEQTVESVKRSQYPHYEIVMARPQSLATVDEWWPLNQIHGEFVLLVAAGERITESFLADALNALTRHPGIEAIYPIVQEKGAADRWQVPKDGTKAQIALPEQSLIRPFMRYHALERFFPEGDEISPDDDTIFWRLMIQMVREGVHPELLPMLGVTHARRVSHSGIRKVWRDQAQEILGDSGFELALWYLDGRNQQITWDFPHPELGRNLELVRRLARHLPTPVAAYMKKAWKKIFKPSCQESG